MPPYSAAIGLAPSRFRRLQAANGATILAVQHVNVTIAEGRPALEVEREV